MADAALLHAVRQDLYVKKAKLKGLEEECQWMSQVVEGMTVYVEEMERELKEANPDHTDDTFAMTMGDALVEVLADGEPMARKDICRRIEAMGIHVGGRNPVDTVGARLSGDRQKRFVTDGKGNWHLRHPPVKVEASQHDANGSVELLGLQTGLAEG